MGFIVYVKCCRMVDSVPRWQLHIYMGPIYILANTVRLSLDCRSDDTAFGAGTFSWQDRVHSWKAGPGEVCRFFFDLFIVLGGV